jgi:hypothetical protein
MTIESKEGYSEGRFYKPRAPEYYDAIDIVAEWVEEPQAIDASGWWVVWWWPDKYDHRSYNVFASEESAREEANSMLVMGCEAYDNIAIAPLGSTKLERIK